MATYTISTHSVTDACTLQKALSLAGDSNAEFTLNGSIVVTTDVLTEAQVTAAVSDAAEGGLIDNKVAKIKQVKSYSEQLVGEGIEAFSSGKYVSCSRIATDEYYTEYEFFVAHPSKISASSPYAVLTFDDEYVTTSNAADINTLAEDAAYRRIYIYTAALNADGSKGEVQLIDDIMAAADQTALDAITDTRA